MNNTAKMFFDIGEPFAAGFFEIESASPARAFCRAYRRLLEYVPLPKYKPEDSLYPYKGLEYPNCCVNPQYCRQYWVDFGGLGQKSKECEKIFREFHSKHSEFLDADGKEAGAKYAANDWVRLTTAALLIA